MPFLYYPVILNVSKENVDKFFKDILNPEQYNVSIDDNKDGKWKVVSSKKLTAVDEQKLMELRN